MPSSLATTKPLKSTSVRYVRAIDRWKPVQEPECMCWAFPCRLRIDVTGTSALQGWSLVTSDPGGCWFEPQFHALQHGSSSCVVQESIKGETVNPPYWLYSQGNSSKVIFRPLLDLEISGGLDTSSWSCEQQKRLNSVFILQENIRATSVIMFSSEELAPMSLNNLRRISLEIRDQLSHPSSVLMQCHYLSSTHTSLNIFSLSAKESF